jgi:hypothetical protein
MDARREPAAVDCRFPLGTVTDRISAPFTSARSTNVEPSYSIRMVLPAETVFASSIRVVNVGSSVNNRRIFVVLSRVHVNA